MKYLQTGLVSTPNLFSWLYLSRACALLPSRRLRGQRYTGKFSSVEVSFIMWSHVSQREGQPSRLLIFLNKEHRHPVLFLSRFLLLPFSLPLPSPHRRSLYHSFPFASTVQGYRRSLLLPKFDLEKEQAGSQECKENTR